MFQQINHGCPTGTTVKYALCICQNTISFSYMKPYPLRGKNQIVEIPSASVFTNSYDSPYPYLFLYLFPQFEALGAKKCGSAPQVFYLLFVYLSTFISLVPGRGWGG